jgi:hypothetical protein
MLTQHLKINDRFIIRGEPKDQFKKIKDKANSSLDKNYSKCISGPHKGDRIYFNDNVHITLIIKGDKKKEK